MTENMTFSNAQDATPAALKTLNDEALRDLVSKAQALLAERDAMRKREAIAKIKALAKAHGLDVAIGNPPRNARGRRPKVKAEAAEHERRET